MPDAETDNPPQGEAPGAPPTEDAGRESAGDAATPSRKGGKRFLILCAGVALAAGGAGYAVAVFTGDESPLAPASAQAQEDETPGPEVVKPPADAVPPGKPDEETVAYAYKDLEPITVNLDEPRLARYVRATITLAIPQEHFQAGSTRIDAETRVLRDWLTVYLTSLTLEDVRGPANLNRIRREILDAFNQELWPEGKPLIRKVLFKEFAVK